jgi:hypothetical protein
MVHLPSQVEMDQRVSRAGLHAWLGARPRLRGRSAASTRAGTASPAAPPPRPHPREQRTGGNRGRAMPSLCSGWSPSGGGRGSRRHPLTQETGSRVAGGSERIKAAMLNTNKRPPLPASLLQIAPNHLGRVKFAKMRGCSRGPAAAPCRRRRAARAGPRCPALSPDSAVSLPRAVQGPSRPNAYRFLRVLFKAVCKQV